METIKEAIYREELNFLCDTAIEQQLTSAQFERLEQLIADDPEAGKYYVEHIALHLDLIEQCMNKERPQASGGLWSRIPTKELFRRSRRFAVLATSLLTLIAVFFILWSISNSFRGMKLPKSPEIELVQNDDHDSIPHVSGTQEVEPAIQDEPDKHFARIREMVRGCQWDNDVQHGMRIGKEELRLTQGIAQVQFDNGVLVTMEAPVHMSVHSLDRCFLHSGKVVARVSPEGTGFVIDTPKAVVEDLGTEFGVQVQEGKEAEVRVFSGRVDIHQKQNEIIPLLSGRRLRFSSHNDAPFNPNIDIVGRSVSISENEVVCTTADGNGKEAFVLSGGDYKKLGSPVPGESDVYILVKNSGGPENRWNRKGYFTIDLSSVPSRLLENAQLELTFGPTGVGFESRSAEVAKFSVYGIVDQEKDSWVPESITWENAPANMPGGNNIDLTQVILIGNFEIKRDEQSDVRILSGMALKQFLEADTNNLVTFVIVCDTQEPISLGMGFAYGFANKYHPDLPPPTLRLVLAEE